MHVVIVSMDLWCRSKLRISWFYSRLWKFSHEILDIPYPSMLSVNILGKFSPQNAPFLLIHKRFLTQKFPAIH